MGGAVKNNLYHYNLPRVVCMKVSKSVMLFARVPSPYQSHQSLPNSAQVYRMRWEKIRTSLYDILFPVLNFYPKSIRNQISYNLDTSIVLPIIIDAKKESLNTVDDTILMQVETGFSLEVGKDFLNRENGRGFYYTIFGEEAIESLWIFKIGVIRFECTPLH